MARRARVQLTEEMQAAAEEAIRDLELTVRFIITDYSVEFIAQKVRTDEYYVPDYQREMVWSEADQSRFIESVLIGLPIPVVFLWQNADGRMEIVDGSQRMRTLHRFIDNELRLSELELLPEVNDFRFCDLSLARMRKFNARTLRGIVLENATTVATRTEMFARINTAGRSANDAEIRRGSLPGLFMNLVIECAQHEEFERLTPISQRLISAREREELVVRFFTFVEKYNPENRELPGWRDRPREYIFQFVEAANARAQEEANYLDRLRSEFDQMIEFVAAAFPNGFLKTVGGRQVPRARYEAISVGSSLALRERPELSTPPIQQVDWTEDEEFQRVTTSDAANVRSKVVGRIEFVRQRLIAQ